MTMSGVIMLMGLRIAFKLSGSSVLPAYPAEKVESGNKRGGSGVSIQS